MVAHAITKWRLVATLAMGSSMVVVQKFRQLLPQAFVALAFVTEEDRAFKEGFLQLLGQMAPKVECCGSENEKIAVIARGCLWCSAYRHCSFGSRRLAAALQDNRRSLTNQQDRGSAGRYGSRIDDGTATL
jgi:hypothetical protein